MEYSNGWLQLCKAEDEYFTCRYNFMRHEEVMASDLAKALLGAGDRETALRFLLQMKLKTVLVSPLLAKIMDAAIDSGNLNTIELARGVLTNYKDDPGVSDTIQACAATYLAKNDEWHYRRIAELYELLEYKEALADFLLLCQANNNWEIRELADDFPHAQD